MTTTATPSPMHTHAMIPIQLVFWLLTGAMLEDGSGVLSSGTLTVGSTIELVLEELSSEEIAEEEEDSGSLEDAGREVGRRELLGLEEEGGAAEEGGSEAGGVTGGSLGVSGGCVSTGGSVGVVAGGVSGVGSTTGAVGSGAGSTGGGKEDSGVRPMTCCCWPGSSVAKAEVPMTGIMQRNKKKSINARLCFFNFKPPGRSGTLETARHYILKRVWSLADLNIRKF